MNVSTIAKYKLFAFTALEKFRTAFCNGILQYLNEALEASGVPLEIVDGYIGSITVTIPWSALVNDNTVIDISDLELTIKPKYREDNGGNACFCS